MRSREKEDEEETPPKSFFESLEDFLNGRVVEVDRALNDAAQKKD